MTAPALLAERRSNVVNCADELFTEHGFHNPDLKTVGTAARVSAIDMAEIFTTKDDLLEAVVDHRHESWLGRVRDCCDHVDAEKDKVLAVFIFLEKWFAGDAFPKDMFVRQYTELGADLPWVAAMAKRHVAAFSTYVEDLADGGDLPRSLGASIAILAEGAQVTAALSGTPAPAREARTAAALLIATYRVDLDLPDFFR